MHFKLDGLLLIAHFVVFICLPTMTDSGQNMYLTFIEIRLKMEGDLKQI